MVTVRRGGSCWHLVVRGQGCCSTSYQAQDRPPALPPAQVSSALGMVYPSLAVKETKAWGGPLTC